jgi:hypothetical protein
METSQYDALDARLVDQQKQIDALVAAVKFLEQKLPSYCRRCQVGIPPPAFGSR